jgi:hypothetical protein
MGIQFGSSPDYDLLKKPFPERKTIKAVEEVKKEEDE